MFFENHSTEAVFTNLVTEHSRGHHMTHYVDIDKGICMNLSKRDLTLKKERGNQQLDIMVVCMGVVGTMGAASMVRSHILFPFRYLTVLYTTDAIHNRSIDP